jgi:hypothetical protein
MFICYAIVLWLLPVTLHATVYVWQEDSRHKYFSDRPQHDATLVTLPPVQTYKATQSDIAQSPVADSQWQTLTMEFTGKTRWINKPSAIIRDNLSCMSHWNQLWPNPITFNYRLIMWLTCHRKKR